MRKKEKKGVAEKEDKKEKKLNCRKKNVEKYWRQGYEYALKIK